MTYVDAAPRRRWPALTAVALVHAAIGYALVSGLAITVIQRLPTVLTLENISEPPPPPPAELPPPRPAPRTPATTVDRPVPQVPVPMPLPGPTATIDLLPPPPIEPVETIQPPSLRPVPPAVDRTTAARAAPDRARWIGTDDYPAAAQRAGAEGTVAISVTLDARGRAQACTVTASSGSPDLDRATCALYLRRARYQPARDAGGSPIGTTVSDRIVWRLPK